MNKKGEGEVWAEPVSYGDRLTRPFREPLLVLHDAKHSQREDRFFALSRTATDRRLFLVFTFRLRRVRVISARDMNRRE